MNEPSDQWCGLGGSKLRTPKEDTQKLVIEGSRLQDLLH